MYAKLIAAGVTVIALGVLGYVFLDSHSSVAHADTKVIKLVPPTLGTSLMLENWHNDRGDGIVEVGARYAADTYGPAPIMLDYFRGYPRAHNGIGCFLTQGDDLVSERLRSLRTASGLVVFDVGIVRSGDTLRMVAATACTPKECRGERLPYTGDGLNLQWELKNLINDPYSEGVVPVAIILELKANKREQDAVISKLAAQLERVAALVDLAPAQRLAAAQGG